ncbi:MAG: cyclic nucleotide-binding domain-containing protein [Gemmataceae bacterium]
MIDGITDTFASHDFLRQLSERALLRLVSGATPFTAKPGQYLARQGTPSHAFFLIQSGNVALGTSGPKGDTITIQTVGPGESVGWSWLVPPYRWQFDCRAVDEVKGLKFDAEWLRAECEQDCELGYQLLKQLAKVLAERLVMTRLRLVQTVGAAAQKRA